MSRFRIILVIIFLTSVKSLFAGDTIQYFLNTKTAELFVLKNPHDSTIEYRNYAPVNQEIVFGSEKDPYDSSSIAPQVEQIKLINLNGTLENDYIEYFELFLKS